MIFGWSCQLSAFSIWLNVLHRFLLIIAVKNSLTPEETTGKKVAVVGPGSHDSSYDKDKGVIAIKGTATLKDSLMDDLEENDKAVYFKFGEYEMYSQRESELIQRYLQEYGEMPGGGDDELDDLF